MRVLEEVGQLAGKQALLRDRRGERADAQEQADRGGSRVPADALASQLHRCYIEQGLYLRIEEGGGVTGSRGHDSARSNATRMRG